MNDDILLRFLNKNLISVGGEDAKLTSLRRATDDLTSILRKTPIKATSFALVAFDPDVPGTDPVFAEVADALQKRWETYVNTFAETPVTVFRAMLLDALTKTALENDAVAVAFIASARNTLPFMEVGEERGIWFDVVGEVQRRIEDRAETAWATPASVALPQVKIDPPPTEGASVEGSDPRGMTEHLLATISKHLAEAVSSTTVGLQRRTNLLWWKEAMFSPSIRTSYRSIRGSVAATLMAFDMHRQVPTLSPASVAAFLQEAVMALPTIDSAQETPIRSLVEEACDAAVLADLRTEAGNLVAAPTGRGPLLALIGHRDVLPQIDDRKFRDRAGVKPDTALTLPDWSVWIFLELQAARAATETAAPKRRTSRKKLPRK